MWMWGGIGGADEGRGVGERQGGEMWERGGNAREARAFEVVWEGGEVRLERGGSGEMSSTKGTLPASLHKTTDRAQNSELICNVYI